MTVLTEKKIQIKLPVGLKSRKFDDPSKHGLSYCMKAVDFIVELPDCLLFIEIKDPDYPSTTPKQRTDWISEFQSGKLNEALKYKYRDSLLYELASGGLEWASGGLKKPVYFLVLIAFSTLSEAELLLRTDDLKRKLPLNGPPSGLWKQHIVSGCSVFNIKTWNKKLPQYPVTRIL